MKYLLKYSESKSQDVCSDLNNICVNYLTELYDKNFQITVSDSRSDTSRKAAYKIKISTPNIYHKWVDIKDDVIQFMLFITTYYDIYKMTQTQKNSLTLGIYSVYNIKLYKPQDYVFFRVKGPSRLYLNFDEIIDDTIDDDLMISSILIYLNPKKNKKPSN